MKLVTLNLWQGRLNRNYPYFIADQKADIICLQEVYSSDIEFPVLEQFRSRQYVQEASGLEHSFFSPTYGFTVMGSKVQFGNLILSRYPFSSQKTIFTSGEYRDLNAPTDYVPNTRNAQVAKIQVDGKELTIVNHHGHWEPSVNGSEVSLARLEFLASQLKDIQGPYIVAGDFNVSSKSEAMSNFKNILNLTDLKQGQYESTLTGIVTPYIVDCDYILISKEVNSQSFEVSDQLVSDHRPLILEFNLSQ